MAKLASAIDHCCVSHCCASNARPGNSHRRARHRHQTMTPSLGPPTLRIAAKGAAEKAAAGRRAPLHPAMKMGIERVWKSPPKGAYHCDSAHLSPWRPAMVPANPHHLRAAIRSDRQPSDRPNPGRSSCAAVRGDAPKHHPQTGGLFQATDPCVDRGCPSTGNFARVCPP